MVSPVFQKNFESHLDFCERQLKTQFCTSSSLVFFEATEYTYNIPVLWKNIVDYTVLTFHPHFNYEVFDKKCCVLKTRIQPQTKPISRFPT